MAGQLLPLPEFDPRSTRELTMAQRISAWFDLLEFGEQMIVAAARRDLGDNADRRTALKKSYERSLQEHDKMMIHMMEEFRKRGAPDGC